MITEGSQEGRRVPHKQLGSTKSYLLSADRSVQQTLRVRIQALAQTMHVAFVQIQQWAMKFRPGMVWIGALAPNRAQKSTGFVKYFFSIAEGQLTDFHRLLPAHKWLISQSEKSRSSQYPQQIGKPSLASTVAGRILAPKILSRTQQGLIAFIYMQVRKSGLWICLWFVFLSEGMWKATFFFFLSPLLLALYQEWSFFSIPANTSITSFTEGLPDAF